MKVLKKKEKNYGIGIAVAGAERRKSPTWNACVAEVFVDPDTGIVDVKKLTYAIDCGTIINRDGALAQVEGSALFGLSMALHEELEFTDGGFPQKNFNEYKMLRLKDAPEIEVELIETGGQPVGLGVALSVHFGGQGMPLGALGVQLVPGPPRRISPAPF